MCRNIVILYVLLYSVSVSEDLDTFVSVVTVCDGLICWLYANSYCSLFLGLRLSLKGFAVNLRRYVLILIGEPFNVPCLNILFYTSLPFSGLHIWWLPFRLLNIRGYYLNTLHFVIY